MNFIIVLTNNTLWIVDDINNVEDLMDHVDFVPTLDRSNGPYSTTLELH